MEIIFMLICLTGYLVCNSKKDTQMSKLWKPGAIIFGISVFTILVLVYINMFLIKQSYDAGLVKRECLICGISPYLKYVFYTVPLLTAAWLFLLYRASGQKLHKLIAVFYSAAIGLCYYFPLLYFFIREISHAGFAL